MNTKNSFRNIRNRYLMDGEQYLQNLYTIIEDSAIKKGNEFEQTVMKNDKFNDPYELTKLIIHRHFLIKTFEEINQESKKDNRQFRIHFILMTMHINILMIKTIITLKKKDV